MKFFLNVLLTIFVSVFLLLQLYISFPDILEYIDSRVVALLFIVFAIWLFADVIYETSKVKKRFEEIGKSGKYKQYDALYWLKGDITVYRKNKKLLNDQKKASKNHGEDD